MTSTGVKTSTSLELRCGYAVYVALPKQKELLSFSTLISKVNNIGLNSVVNNVYLNRCPTNQNKTSH